MMIEEYRRQVEELKGRYHAPYSSSDKVLIRSLYKQIMGRDMRVGGCQSCYHDAVIELYLHLKHRTMDNRKYQLRAGVILQSPLINNGEIYSHHNITDEVAEQYIELFPERKSLFTILEDEKKPMKRGRKPKKEAKDEAKEEAKGEDVANENNDNEELS